MYRDRIVALVLPAYNEQRLLPKTLEAVPEYVDHVYVVDDASIDDTRNITLSYKAQDPRIELLRHEKNTGPGGAIITGYLRASQDHCDVVVVAGADYQMPFDQMTDLLDPVVDGRADYTKGNRFLAGGNAFDEMPKTRLFGNTFLSLITKIASGYFKIFDVVDGYTAISKRVIDTIDWSHVWKGYGYPMDFLVHLNAYGFRVKDVPRRAIYLSGERQSQIKGFSYIMRVTPMLARRFFWRIQKRYLFSDFHPLVFLYLVSFLLIPIGTAMAAYIILAKFQGLTPTGATAVACALVLNVGIQSFFFAMLFDMLEEK